MTAMNVADLEHDSGMTDDDEEDRKFLLLVALALLLRRMFRKRKFVANMQPRRQLDFTVPKNRSRFGERKNAFFLPLVLYIYT